ncbi:phosphopantetheine-binding protein [Burkholderia pyrrocinia]|uniref:phosphopantetheine-binding protein n=1 Tax=Burkholderia pyrrocinia TaxID=60550 RepID=UPI0024BF188D|nr:phosphopantetheine-binding protein [Burkholderia pyrrocinia]
MLACDVAEAIPHADAPLAARVNDALRRARADGHVGAAVVGAVPFDVDAPAVLRVARTMLRARPLDAQRAAGPAGTRYATREVPSADAYADAVADFSEREHRMALDYVAGRCGMAVTTDALVGVAPADDAAPMLAAIAAQVARSLRMPAADLREHDNLVDCGLDSIRMMTLVEQWRAQGYDVTFVQLAEQPTLGAWTRVLQRAAQVSA